MMIFDILNLHCYRYRKEYVVEAERMMCFIMSVILLFTGEVNAKSRKYISVPVQKRSNYKYRCN
jgi:hypothetical protein